MAQRRSEYPPGKGKELDAAMKNAYGEAAKLDRERGHEHRQKSGDVVYVVDRIELHGTNPFTEYHVFLLPHG